MAVTAKRKQSKAADVRPVGQLGIDQPAGWWPSTPRLKSYEAAGFQHVQVRMPHRDVLANETLMAEHARALAARVGLTGMQLIVHAPDDLLAGTHAQDAQLDGALRYASLAGAELVVYHGARIPATARGIRDRLAAERRSLRGRLGRLGRLGIKLAIENLAPAYPGCEHVSDDLTVVQRLVDALDSDRVGLCLDLGHAHIAATGAGTPLSELIEPALSRVLLFHVHDNFGRRTGTQPAGWVEPVRLDLHLPPGAGTLPWEEIAPLLADHPAPRLLEIHPSSRPQPATLAVMTRELLGQAAVPR